jgi:two-component system CheB/CheR fusion protein
VSAVPENNPVPQDEPLSFPIVGIGASAGGLEAFTLLLNALPTDTGMAFVLVQHLAPKYPSALSEILGRATKMPVTEIRDGQIIEPNNIYVIPPDREITISRGIFQVRPRPSSGQHRPIDVFFRSLAEDRAHKAIGVILSGTANDGTLGLQAIKADGGITFAQNDTAQHDGMPHSAIAVGCVDLILAPDEISRELSRIGHHLYAAPDGSENREPANRTKLAEIIKEVHGVTGVDFSNYRKNTLYRRITRRMAIRKMDGLKQYLPFLRDTPGEAEALYQDILINVTSFFRNPEAFEALKSKVFPRLIEARSGNNPLLDR